MEESVHTYTHTHTHKGTNGLVYLCMASKSLQLCPTLHNPLDCSPPVSTVDSPGKNTGVGCCALLQRIFQPKDNLVFLTSMLIAFQIGSNVFFLNIL